MDKQWFRTLIHFKKGTISYLRKNIVIFLNRMTVKPDKFTFPIETCITFAKMKELSYQPIIFLIMQRHVQIPGWFYSINFIFNIQSIFIKQSIQLQYERGNKSANGWTVPTSPATRRCIPTGHCQSPSCRQRFSLSILPSNLASLICTSPIRWRAWHGISTNIRHTNHLWSTLIPRLGLYFLPVSSNIIQVI